MKEAWLKSPATTAPEQIRLVPRSSTFRKGVASPGVFDAGYVMHKPDHCCNA